VCSFSGKTTAAAPCHRKRAPDRGETVSLCAAFLRTGVFVRHAGAGELSLRRRRRCVATRQDDQALHE
jgi:hypothetical protein